MMNDNSFISSSVIKEHGRMAYYDMLDKARQGELVQVRRGVYASVEQLTGNMIDVDAVVPGAVLCLWSAWNIHQLTTSSPQAFHLAVKRDRKVTLPQFPPIRVHHISEPLLSVGVISTTIDGYSVRVYDVERSVCDAVKFRNKVGMDVCSEILDNYLRRPDRNISKLMDYASILRVASLLNQYLSVKL